MSEQTEQKTVKLTPEHVRSFAALAMAERTALAEQRAAAAELELVRERRGRLVAQLSAAYARDGLVLDGIDPAQGTATVHEVPRPVAEAAE